MHIGDVPKYKDYRPKVKGKYIILIANLIKMGI